ncbi:MAG: CBS domain-containing protein [Methanoregulaceae archaeon]|nr:CBS domain-containing protein [Methanoregulaceae archaeon]
MKGISDFMIDVPVLKYDDQVTKARQMLRDDIFREIYVHDGKKKLMGYIDITDVLKVTATKSNVTVEGYIKDAPAVHLEDPIEKAIKSIKDSRTDSAAVVDLESHILGGVLLSDLFPVIISRHELKGLVNDYMSSKVITCAPEDPIQRIHNTIVESGFTAFPVIKKNKILGIISRSDLLRAAAVRKSLEQTGSTPVEHVMTKTVITATPEMQINTAAELMVKHDISRLPVVIDGRVVGIFDRHDVMKGLSLR